MGGNCHVIARSRLLLDLFCDAKIESILAPVMQQVGRSLDVVGAVSHVDDFSGIRALPTRFLKGCVQIASSAMQRCQLINDLEIVTRRLGSLFLNLQRVDSLLVLVEMLGDATRP